MPEEAAWESFFDPARILDQLALSPACRNLAEFGCGYGTFTIAAAQLLVEGMVYAFDIEPEMVELTRHKADAAGLRNVRTVLRDFVADGTGLLAGSAEYVMLFNILHVEQPLLLLRESWRVLAPGGLLGVIHWNYDPATPRGPSMDIRPRPQQCRDWALSVGYSLRPRGIIDLPPFHYGMVLTKPNSN